MKKYIKRKEEEIFFFLIDKYNGGRIWTLIDIMKSLRCVTWIARFLVRNTILKALNFSSKLTINLSSPFEFLHFICFGFAWIIHVLMAVYLWGWGRPSTMLVHNFKDLWKLIKVVLFYTPEVIKWIELYMNKLKSKN